VTWPTGPLGMDSELAQSPAVPGLAPGASMRSGKPLLGMDSELAQSTAVYGHVIKDVLA
jgi:hypothetical protein